MSRQDDSDDISDDDLEQEQIQPRPHYDAADEEEKHAPQLLPDGDVASDSESIEDSVMSQDGDENVNAMEESVYDEEAQKREERMHLVQIFG